MLHYDGSKTDAGAVAWFKDPRCNVSYQMLVLDDGSEERIAPDSARAWHAGVCRASNPQLTYRDANSAFYGIAAANGGKEDVTAPQLEAIARRVRIYFDLHGWDRVVDAWRIVGHSSEAWPRGRKTDPEGGNRNDPIFTPADVRRMLLDT